MGTTRTRTVVYTGAGKPYTDRSQLEFTLVEKQAIAAFLWDRWFKHVNDLAQRRDWQGLINIISFARFNDLEEQQRIAALMWAQRAKVRANGKVYASDARRTLERVARKSRTADPEGFRREVHAELISERNRTMLEPQGEADLLRAIGLEIPRRGNGSSEWPPVGQIVPFEPPSDDEISDS